MNEKTSSPNFLGRIGRLLGPAAGASAAFPGTQAGWTSKELVLLSLILLAAAGFRFIGLGTQPLWLDEGYSWWDAAQSLESLWTLVPQCDPHPPLYFLLLKGWVAIFGDSTIALRALSVLFSVLATGAIVLAGREFTPRIGWLAGILFALQPFQVELSQEARPYALLCLGGALLVFGAMRIARVAAQSALPGNPAQAGGGRGPAPAARPGWLALAGGAIIVMWTNNTAALMLIAVFSALGLVLAAERSSRRMLQPLFGVAALVVLLWLPYLPVMLEQARGVMSDFWIPKPEGWRIPHELRMLVSLNKYDAVWWGVFGLACGLLLMWRRGLWRQAILLGALAIVPVLLNYLVSVSIRPIFLARAMIGVVPAVAVVVAATSLLLSRQWLRRSAVLLLIGAHLLAFYDWRTSYGGKEPWDRIAQEVAAGAASATERDKAMVLVTANELALPLNHALEELELSVPVQGAPDNFPSPGLAAKYPSGKCAPSLLGLNLDAIRRAVQGRKVIYFVTRHNNVYDPGNRIAGFLRSLGWIPAAMKSYMPGYLEVHKFVMPGGLAPRGAALSVNKASASSLAR